MELLIPKKRLELKGTPERGYCNDFIENQLIPEKLMRSCHKWERQKRKFKLITKLVSDLFKHANSQRCFITISNLLVLLLISFDDDCPLDLYSVKKTKSKNNDSYLKKILANELDIEDLPN